VDDFNVPDTRAAKRQKPTPLPLLSMATQVDLGDIPEAVDLSVLRKTSKL